MVDEDLRRLMSARRATWTSRTSAEAGNMTRTPHYNSTWLLREARDDRHPDQLIEQSAAPLAAIETSFAVDSTGFGTCVYRRWYDEKYGRPMKKAHVAQGSRHGRHHNQHHHVGQGHGFERRGLPPASRAGGVHQAALRHGRSLG
jgi:hypothetical protein